MKTSIIVGAILFLLVSLLRAINSRYTVWRFGWHFVFEPRRESYTSWNKFSKLRARRLAKKLRSLHRAESGYLNLIRVRLINLDRPDALDVCRKIQKNYEDIYNLFCALSNQHHMKESAFHALQVRLAYTHEDILRLHNRVQLYNGIETLFCAREAGLRFEETFLDICEETSRICAELRALMNLSAAPASDAQDAPLTKTANEELYLREAFNAVFAEARKCASPVIKAKTDTLYKLAKPVINAENTDPFAERLCDRYLPTLKKMLSALSLAEENRQASDIESLTKLASETMEIISCALHEFGTRASTTNIQDLRAEANAIKNFAILRGDIVAEERMVLGCE